MLEKRKWPRMACLERCSVQPQTDGTQSHPSRVLNYSLSGLRVETDTPLGKGEYVKIRLHDDSADKVLAGVEQRMGKVQWCSDQPEQFSGFFEIGIEMVGGISDQVHNWAAQS